MTRLDREARVTIKALVLRGTSNAVVARLLGVSEGAVRYTGRGWRRVRWTGAAHRRWAYASHHQVLAYSTGG